MAKKRRFASSSVRWRMAPPPPLPYAPLGGVRRRRRGGILAAWARPLAAVAAGAASAYALASLYRSHVERLQEAARRECAPRCAARFSAFTPAHAPLDGRLAA
jgi:hypothetical protein